MSGRRHVDVRPRCRNDVFECAEQLNQDSPSAARRFVAAFEEAMRTLADYPFSGTVVAFRSETLQNCRTWTLPGFRNWLIIYRVTESSVEALRVVHGARDFDELDG